MPKNYIYKHHFLKKKHHILQEGWDIKHGRRFFFYQKHGRRYDHYYQLRGGEPFRIGSKE